MRHSNLKLAHGTQGNPQQSLEQNEIKEISKKLELKLANNNREKMLSSVKTQKAKSILSELYRLGATIGDGSTADMLIHEAINGITHGKKITLSKSKR